MITLQWHTMQMVKSISINRSKLINYVFNSQLTTKKDKNAFAGLSESLQNNIMCNENCQLHIPAICTRTMYVCTTYVFATNILFEYIAICNIFIFS